MNCSLIQHGLLYFLSVLGGMARALFPVFCQFTEATATGERERNCADMLQRPFLESKHVENIEHNTTGNSKNPPQTKVA
jgi:hypothetical protein